MTPISFISVIVVSLLVWCTVIFGSAFAAGDVYTVSEIHIEAEASSAFEAQRTALSEGQILAAERLIERMTLIEDRQNLELMPMDAQTAAGLIAGLQIKNEQRTSTRYSAVISVQFDPRELRQYFNANGLPYVESKGDPVLIIPVFDTLSGSSIYENDWYSTWSVSGFENALTPVIMIGSKRDSQDVPIEDGLFDIRSVLSRDYTTLQQLAELYGVSQIALVLAERIQEVDPISTTIPGETAPETIVQARGELIRFQTPVGNDNLNLERLLEAVSSNSEPLGMQIQVSALNAFITEGLSMAALDLIGQIETFWKTDAVVRSKETGEFSVTILYNTLGEWQSLQGAVAGASLIQSARLDAISNSGATMTITHRGAMQQVHSELAARGVSLSLDPDIGWTACSR